MIWHNFAPAHFPSKMFDGSGGADRSTVDTNGVRRCRQCVNLAGNSGFIDDVFLSNR